MTDNDAAGAASGRDAGGSEPDAATAGDGNDDTSAVPDGTAPGDDGETTSDANRGAETGADAGADDATGATCGSASDCQAVDDYCGSCRCLALKKGESAPTCAPGNTVSCIVAPCSGKSAVCGSTGICSISP
jgi:hypothetical protein